MEEHRELKRPHLTHVERKPEASKATPWEASCLCGWLELTRLKSQAITAAELHWLAHPVVTA